MKGTVFDKIKADFNITKRDRYEKNYYYYFFFISLVNIKY